MPTVFVVQQDRKKNFATATAHGTVRFIFAADYRALLNPPETLATLRYALASAEPGDFLVPTGDPVAIAMAANVMDRMTGGRYNLLKWESGLYLPVLVNLNANQ